MSDTTSTNISVAQANSIDSVQTGSVRQSNLTRSNTTKKLCFYKSGDPRFSGIKMVVTNRSFKTFDALLDSLSKKVPLPFGVRNITTPRGIHHVTNLEELEDGKSYICSQQKKVKPINLERANKKPLRWQSSRPLSSRRRAVHEAKLTEFGSFQRENTVVIGNSKKLVVLKNGDTEFKHNIFINKKSMQSFDDFLEEITEALQYPVFKLYSTDGRRIPSIRALLLSSGTIVAAGREPFKPANYETEREFLPAKLPGITNRVIPKARLKPELKSQLKMNESILTSPSGQENSVSSNKICNTDNNFVDFSYIPQNEISLTEHWPHSGEELPGICPGDNIEKSIHLNSDGTMTVEMRVRFKLKEEETINWSTTVSRSDLLYYKRKLSNSTVEPEIQTISIRDNSLKVDSKDQKSSEAGILENKHESCAKVSQLEQLDTGLNINLYRNARKEKTPFVRPPTPGIRKGQERRASLKIISEGNVRENIRRMFFNNIEQEDVQSETSDSQRNGLSIKQNGIDNKSTECLSSKHRQKSFEVLETSHMELLQSNSRGKTILKKSDITTESSGCVHFNRDFPKDRPHTAGKQVFHQDQFKFKEIKRSVSTSVAFSEPSRIQNEASQGISDFVARDSLPVSSSGTHAEDTHCLEISGEVPTSANHASVSLECKMSDSLENEMNDSHYNQSRDSGRQKKKKKKKIVGDEINLRMHEEREACKQFDGANIENDLYLSGNEARAPKACNINDQSPEVPDLCDQHQASRCILSDDICISHVTMSTEHSEINTMRKLKGNKQMAKVKPRSVRKIDDSSTSKNDNNESGKSEKMEDDNLDSVKVNDNCVSIVDKSGLLSCSTKQAYNPLTDHIQWHVEKASKKVTKISKKSHKSVKKPKDLKKKTKTKMPLTNRENGTEIPDATQVVSSPILYNSFESYVQSWLKNIFPNATFPVIQLFPSPRKDDITSSKNSQHSEKEANIMDADVHTNVHSKETTCDTELNKIQPANIIVPHEQSLDDGAVSVLMERDKHLAELIIQHFADFENNAPREGNKSDELVNWIIRNQTINPPQKKASLDVAVQVESVDEYQPVPKSDNCVKEVLVEQSQSPPMNIQKTKACPLEKSFSLPGLSSKGSSSSSQVLLAWLIVLHLKQGMMYKVDNVVSKSSSIGIEIFTLLQSLKKIAISEKADDLKAAVINLQESALRHDADMESLLRTCEEATAKTISTVPQMEESGIREIFNNQNLSVGVECTLGDNEIRQTQNCNSLLTHDNNDFTDYLDDFFASVPSTEISGEHLKHSTAVSSEATDQTSISKTELQESKNNTSNETQRNTGQFAFKESIADNNKSWGTSMNLSKCHKGSSMSDVNYEADATDKTNMTPSKKVSKVKMMVQEMEQRKCCTYNSEHRKCTHSPLSSDWSDYRQDSEESLNSETLQASSEIMTESGEEQIQEKPIKTGYVRRAIERLYGKADSKISPVFVSTKNATQKKIKESPKQSMKQSATFGPAGKSSSKENILRTLSSPSNYSKTRNREKCTDSFKSTSLPLLELEYFHNKGLETEMLNNDEVKHTESELNGGVLIDKGRWLLKDNHLVRRSPPETIGMYSHLDTTSADTFLDTTSDEVLYTRSVGKMNQQLPLGDISSSEIEDMVKPQHCHYFNMPHGSDSEPFNDAFSVNTRGRPKSSDTLYKTQDLPSTTLLKKCGDISGSLPSFATMDLHFSDNKVHPLPQHGVEETSEGQTSKPNSRSRAQVKEQDSLDKLHFVCGQHCPILAAIIVPINEARRGFAYQSPNDIENLLLFPSESSTKAITPYLANKLLKDENNNISTYYENIKTVNICNSNNNKPFPFSHVCTRQGPSQYLVEMCSSSTLNRLLNKSRKIYNTTHIKSVFTDNDCTQTDENNNVLYQMKLL